jgi:capsular exopolysaccharide synthesis family protein
MSRVYDALQQCCPDQVYPDPVYPAVQEDNGRARFVEPVHDAVWEHDTAPIVPANFSSDDRIPALCSAYGFASEQFRLLATRLQQMQQKGTLKSILLTSSVAQEGKSLLTVNLAIALAQGARQRILLVDADLRNSGVGRTLRMGEPSGIRDWYQSTRPITDFICRLAGLNVWVLPAGQAAVDPLELLKSPRMFKLLSEMSAAFDWLLIDSTPLLPIADAEVLSRLTDGTIVVVRRDKSVKPDLKQALARVAPSKMVGLLLNDFPVNGNYGDSYTVANRADGPEGSLQAKLGVTSTQIRQLIFRFRDFTRASERWRTLSTKAFAELHRLSGEMKVVRAVLKKLMRKCRETLDERRKRVLRRLDRDKQSKPPLNRIRKRRPSISSRLNRHGQSEKMSG